MEGQCLRALHVGCHLLLVKKLKSFVLFQKICTQLQTFYIHLDSVCLLNTQLVKYKKNNELEFESSTEWSDHLEFDLLRNNLQMQLSLESQLHDQLWGCVPLGRGRGPTDIA